MSASSDDVFYSAPDSPPPPNPNSTQDHQQPISTPVNPNPHSRADQSKPPPDKWLLRVASSAGKVISSVLGLSDASSSDDESEGDVAEEKDEFVERIKELKQVPFCTLNEGEMRNCRFPGRVVLVPQIEGRALSQVEEPKTITPLARSEVTVEELVMQETLSRKQREEQINPIQSQRVESSSPFVASYNQLVQIPLSPVQASQIHNVAVAEAKKWSGENKCTSSSFAMPLYPNTSPSPGQTQQLPLESTNLPLNPNPNHCLSPGRSQQQPSSNIIPPLNPLPSPSPGHNQQQPLPNIVPPVNLLPSPSLGLNRQSPSHSAPLLSPNANLFCTNPKQSSSHSSPVLSHPERQSKPCSKRDQPGPKCRLTSFKHKEVLKTPTLIFDPMDEEGSGDKKLPSNLKEVVELFSGDMDYKQLADRDLLDVLEMKGITFEDPPWWPK